MKRASTFRVVSLQLEQFFKARLAIVISFKRSIISQPKDLFGGHTPAKLGDPSID
jgi:hypothetical protein